MVEIIVYRITGKQLLVNIPKSFCEECDLSVAAAQDVKKKMAKKGIKVDVIIRPWANSFFRAILKGIYHPPGVVVGGKLVSQGIVPDKNKIEQAVLEANKKRK